MTRVGLRGEWKGHSKDHLGNDLMDSTTAASVAMDEIIVESERGFLGATVSLVPLQRRSPSHGSHRGAVADRSLDAGRRVRRQHRWPVRMAGVVAVETGEIQQSGPGRRRTGRGRHQLRQ